MVPFWDTSMDEWVCPVRGGAGLQGVQGQMVAGQPRFKSRSGKTYGPPPDQHCLLRHHHCSPEPQPVATLPAQTVEGPGKPIGKPVSEALQLPKSKCGKIYRKVIDLINSVHGDGDLKPIPVETRNLGEGYFGVFRRATRTEPKDIGINPKGDHIETTLAHEIGHYLDNFLGSVKGNDFASEAAGAGRESPLTGWWEALQNSNAYQVLMDMKQNPQNYRLEAIYYSADGTQRKYTKVPDAGFLSYLTTPREFFARSYAQYIAERGGNSDMIAQIAQERTHDLYHDTQWQPEDFAAIAEAMDAALREIGWTQ